jgi:hypothetical protein
MCLVYVEHGAMERLSETEMTALTDASIDADYAADTKGMLICSGPLAPPETAVTIAARNGRTMRTDGPFMETKEWLAGFFLIEAPDLEAAIADASSSPVLKIARVEVRAMVEQTHSRTGAGRPALNHSQRS